MMGICESCDFFDICHAQATAEKSLSQVAYLGKGSRDILRDLRLQEVEEEHRTTEIEDLHLLFSKSEDGYVFITNKSNCTCPLTLCYRSDLLSKFKKMNSVALSNVIMAAPRIKAVHENKVTPTGMQISHEEQH
jgi:hypothetical protein